MNYFSTILKMPYRWLKAKLNKKVPGGKLPVEHVYTFETGEKLYTYRPEDYAKIQSRYYKNIQEAVNYIRTFVMTKQQWNESVEKAYELLEQAMVNPHQQKRNALITDVLLMFKEYKRLATGLKNADQTLLESLFCMFYLLDDEITSTYSEKHNARKLELLALDPIMADFFLTNLKENLKDFYPISEASTLIVLQELERQRLKMFSDTLSKLQNSMQQ